MSNIVLPYPDLTPDTIADALQVKANLEAILAVVNGGLSNGNFGASGALDGNKLSQNSGEQVPEPALGTNAVSSRVLGSHASVDASRAVGTTAIKNLAVGNPQMAVGAALANLAAASVGLSKLSIAQQTRAFDISALSGSVVTQDLTTSPALATATTTILGFYLQNLTNFNGADLSGLWAERITSGANWGIRLHIRGVIPGRITGNVIITSILTT